MAATLAQLKHLLDTQGENSQIFSLGNGASLLIWEDRGRIYGPFFGKDSEGMLWVPQALSSAKAFQDFRQSGQWNAGGDRLWIAPEFPFFTKERAHFNESYTVQDSLDPGHYHFLPSTDGRLVFSAQLSTQLYEHQFTQKSFTMTRSLEVCENPLRFCKDLASLMMRIDYCGYTHAIDLTDTSPEFPMELEIWNLCQVRAGGTFLIPYLGDQFEYVDYYAPSMGKVLSVHPGVASIHVASAAEHKVGAKAFQTFGRVGYLLPCGGGVWQLLIRNYYNNPSDPYIKDPSDRPGENGCSLFVYMNDTRGDGFAELESTGETFCAPEKCSSHLDLNHWFFRGSLADLQPIAKRLLNVDIMQEGLL